MGNPSNGHRKMELKKGPWTGEEDQKLLAYIKEHGHGSWRGLPAKAGLQRCGKSCRLRWTNYLRPDIKRGKFSLQEEKTIIRLHALLGNRWSAIAAHLPKRTDNEIKNYWNTRLKKRLTRMGIDPITHKPKSGPTGPAQSKHAAVVSHMAQWETARLEAETRLVRESKFLSKIQHLRRTTTTTTTIPPPPLPPPPPCLDVLRVWQATPSHNDFFASTRSLDSPTSTLNFSVDSCRRVPQVGAPVVENDDVSENSAGACEAAGKGKFENSAELLQDNSTTSYSMDYGHDGAGSFDLDPITDFNFVCNDYFGDFDESRNYWNNLLSSPLGSPAF